MQGLQGRRAAQFLRRVEPLASRLPYMVLPGNHEVHYNFSHYRWALGLKGGHALAGCTVYSYLRDTWYLAGCRALKMLELLFWWRLVALSLSGPRLASIACLAENFASHGL